jgi:hypothetical protein
VSAGQPTPHPSSDTAVLAYPRPYPVALTTPRFDVLDREVAREAVLATITVVVVAIAAVTAILVSGGLAG